MNETTKKYWAKSFLIISAVNFCAVGFEKAPDINNITPAGDYVYVQASHHHTAHNSPASPNTTLDGITIMSSTSSGDNLGCLIISPA